MKVLSLTVGAMEVNCYIVYCEESLQCVVIDPGDDCDDIMHMVEENHLKPKYILLTHGHFDHIGAVKELKERTDAMVVIHPMDADHLTDASRNLSGLIGKRSVQVPPDLLVEDGDRLEAGHVTLQVIHTPGHTLGGVTYMESTYMGHGALFTGDTLFEGSVGRTDFPGGSHPQLLRSISEKLMILDDSLAVFPGHGSCSTLGRERITNPFLQDMGGIESE
jgi:glyoxylase-like metal-dependent hydrolase (beta-lactamase superfamily II)